MSCTYAADHLDKSFPATQIILTAITPPSLPPFCTVYLSVSPTAGIAHQRQYHGCWV